MKTIETSIDIAAPPERLWAILTDFASYPEWNPFITSISGPLTPGENLKVRIEPPGNGSMTFKPVLLAASPNRELRWKGKIVIGGLFDGEHSFRLSPKAGGTRFEQGERFSGLLVPLLRGVFGPTEQGFRAMNEALKKRAEG
jgi:hypothetical protein